MSSKDRVEDLIDECIDIPDGLGGNYTEVNEDPIKTIEQMFGIELFSYQKDLIRRTLEGDRPVHICMPKNQGRDYLKSVAETAGIIFGVKEKE